MVLCGSWWRAHLGCDTHRCLRIAPCPAPVEGDAHDGGGSVRGFVAARVPRIPACQPSVCWQISHEDAVGKHGAVATELESWPARQRGAATDEADILVWRHAHHVLRAVDHLDGHGDIRV